jgi:Ca2+-binding RTX toxin-like protein
MLDVRVNGVDYDLFDAWFVFHIVIDSGGGDDTIVLAPNIGSKEFFGGGWATVGTFINGGVGNDRIVGSDQCDTINGNAGYDRIDGGLGDDRLAGNGGNDAVAGNLGYDRLYGDNGSDRIDAGNGNDRIYGGDGDDLLGGGAGSDSIYGGNGTDTINGGTGGGTDRVYDAWSNETISGIHIIYVNPIVLSDPSLNEDLDALLS